MNGVIKPEPGRIVWFWPSKAGLAVCPLPDGSFPAWFDEDKPLAAQVAYVWSDRMVNLTIVDQRGRQFAAQSVPLVQPGDARPGAGWFAEWMPFQRAQAAKQEAVAGGLDLSSDAPLAGATCDPSRPEACEACQ